MSLTRRHAGLALAALLILIWAVARHRAGAVPVVAPPAAAAPAPPAPSPVAQVRRVRPKTAAKPPAPPPPVRGAKLREKGEAFGGGTPDRVDEAEGRVTP